MNERLAETLELARRYQRPKRGGWMGERTHCSNGHDLTVPANLYLNRIESQRPARRCKVCIREANNARSMAYGLLRITQRQYLDQYGSSKFTALEIIRLWHEGAI